MWIICMQCAYVVACMSKMHVPKRQVSTFNSDSTFKEALKLKELQRNTFSQQHMFKHNMYLLLWRQMLLKFYVEMQFIQILDNISCMTMYL